VMIFERENGERVRPLLTGSPAAERVAPPIGRMRAAQ